MCSMGKGKGQKGLVQGTRRKSTQRGAVEEGTAFARRERGKEGGSVETEEGCEEEKNGKELTKRREESEASLRKRQNTTASLRVPR